MTVASTGARTRIPRDSEDDYTSAAAAERRAFVEAETGAKLDHLGRYAFDPAILRGNIENFTGARPGSDRARRPAAHRRRTRPGRFLRAPGDDRRNAGCELQPRHAAAHRMRRREDDHRRGIHAALAGLHLRRRARSPRLRRLGRGAFCRDQSRRRSDHAHRTSSSRSSSSRSDRSGTCGSTTRPATPPARACAARPPSRPANGSRRIFPAAPAMSSRATSTRTKELRDHAMNRLDDGKV